MEHLQQLQVPLLQERRGHRRHQLQAACGRVGRVSGDAACWQGGLGHQPPTSRTPHTNHLSRHVKLLDTFSMQMVSLTVPVLRDGRGLS